MLTKTVVHRSHSRQPFEILAEKTGVWKIHIIGYLRHLLVCVAELHLNGIYRSLINPVLRRLATDIPNNGAHIARSDTQMRGIEVEPMTLCRILPHKTYKSCEQLLFT